MEEMSTHSALGRAWIGSQTSCFRFPRTSLCDGSLRTAFSRHAPRWLLANASTSSEQALWGP